MGGDVIGAVFPVDSRSGMTMFLVGGSATDFLINAAWSLFIAVTAFLGIWYFSNGPLSGASSLAQCSP